MPDFDILIFTLEDVREVRKDVSVNIDDFEQYAKEVQRNYLSKMLGDRLYTTMVNNQAEARFVDLIEGVIYEDGGIDVIFRGVKLQVIYAWLRNYAILSASSLSPTGSVTFRDDETITELNRKLAKNNIDHWIGSLSAMETSTLRYLNIKRGIYPEFSQSRQIRQANKDNIIFRASGRRFFTPYNYLE